MDAGALVLIRRENIGSWFEQSLIARRQEHLAYRAKTMVGFDPATYQQAAGMTTYYNRTKFHAALVTHDGDARVLTLMSCPGDDPDGALQHTLDTPIALQDGPALDASVISDEDGRGEHASFTGAFVGMVAFDITGQGRTARFDHFSYTPRPFDRG